MTFLSPVAFFVLHNVKRTLKMCFCCFNQIIKRYSPCWSVLFCNISQFKSGTCHMILSIENNSVLSHVKLSQVPFDHPASVVLFAWCPSLSCLWVAWRAAEVAASAPWPDLLCSLFGIKLNEGVKRSWRSTFKSCTGSLGKVFFSHLVWCSNQAKHPCLLQGHQWSRTGADCHVVPWLSTLFYWECHGADNHKYSHRMNQSLCRAVSCQLMSWEQL